MTEYTLGRIKGPEDPRDKEYPFSLALPIGASTRTWKYWTQGKLKLNQGNQPACVGYTGANWMQASPTRTKVTNTTGLDLYRECKKIDGYDGDGTWDRILMKVLQAQGKVEKYLWAQNPHELDQWLLTTGPVMIGVPWTSDMFSVDKKGFIHITGSEVGGHEVLLTGVNLNTGHYTIVNSWGEGWGVKGTCKISRKDLHSLLFEDWGTACTAIEKKP